MTNDCGYFSGYKPHSVAEQMEGLKRCFPNKLESFDARVAARELPPGAEGMFLVPRWQTVASTYNEAVEVVLALLGPAYERGFYNYRKGDIGPNLLIQTTEKERFFQVIGDEQKEKDVLVFPAQFGLRHQGRSVHHSRILMHANEVGLGVYEIGVMLLTHPDRLASHEDLFINCVGDEYRPMDNCGFMMAPFFLSGGLQLRLDAGHMHDCFSHFGSVSAFLF